ESQTSMNQGILNTPAPIEHV
ncbi:unnamed protein product, partial [Rotaria sordida]